MSRLGTRNARTTHLFAALVACAALSLTGAPRALAQDDDPTRTAARNAFQAGVTAYEAGGYAEALHQFQEAYRLMPNPTVRVNMANCYEQLDRPLEAIDHFERFLVEAGDDAPRDQVREVRAALRRLRARVGEVFIRVQPDGATVTIDGGDSRRTPILDAIPLVAGGHHVTVRMDGHRTVERDIVVDGGGRAEVEVTLEEGSDPEPVGGADQLGQTGEDMQAGDETTEEPEDEGPSSPLFSTPVLISGGATIGVGIIALGTGIAALGANSDYDDAVTDFQGSPRGSTAHVEAQQRGIDAKNRANRLATATDIFLVATLAGAGVTAYFLFFHDDESDTEVAAVPVVTRDAAGLSIAGRF